MQRIVTQRQRQQRAPTGGQGDGVASDARLAQRDPLVDAVLQEVIAAVHVDQRPPRTDEQRRRVGAVANDQRLAREDIETALRGAKRHRHSKTSGEGCYSVSGPCCSLGSTWRANKSASAACG